MFYTHKTSKNGVTEYNGLKYKDHTFRGQLRTAQPEMVDNHFLLNALISKDKIVLYGYKKNYQHNTKESYTTVFKVGDQAEYDSWNLQYLGTITKITDKAVTIVAYKGSNNETVHRLDIHKFARKNYDFNLEEITKNNHETSMYL